jgi:hypothetical protein
MNAAMFRRFPFIRPSRSLLFAVGFAALIVSLSGCAHLPGAVRDAGVAGPAAVAGQVTSDRGAVIVDASVTLTGPSVKRNVRTDISGRFTIERVPLGSYTLSVNATGFKSHKQTVTVDKEATVRADVKLRM